MADESNAHRDEPEHVPGCAGTAVAAVWCSNARPWHRDTAKQGTYVVLGGRQAGRPHVVCWRMVEPLIERVPPVGRDRRYRPLQQDGEQGSERIGEDMAMKTAKIMLFALTLMVLAPTSTTPRAQAQVLTGDQRLACEALLCLAAGANAPRECSNALAKYAALQAQTALQTLALRKNFLQLCPKRNALGAWEGERR